MTLSLVRNNNPASLVSEAGKAIPPSGIRKYFDIAYSIPDCISLGVGEPDFITPWRITDSAIYSLRQGQTHYTPNRGLPALRRAISTMVEKNTQTLYDPDTEILVTVGVSQGLDLALRSIVNPGDEIIVIEPCYVSYSPNITLAYGVAVPVPVYAKDNYQVDIERLEKAITPKTKGIILNYPCNPTGSTFEPATLKKIAWLAEEYNLIIISDEIYSAITYDGEHQSILSIPGMKERTIYLNGFSKSHAMTGWRLGYVAAPPYFLDIMLKIHQYTTLCAPIMAQYAAIEAIEKCESEVTRMLKEYTRRRNYITSRFNEIGLPCLMPKGAFYAFPDITPTGLSDEDFAIKLLKQDKVAVVPGHVFGECGTGHIRCSYATSMENIKEALDRIETFVKKL